MKDNRNIYLMRKINHFSSSNFVKNFASASTEEKEKIAQIFLGFYIPWNVYWTQFDPTHEFSQHRFVASRYVDYPSIIAYTVERLSQVSIELSTNVTQLSAITRLTGFPVQNTRAIALFENGAKALGYSDIEELLQKEDTMFLLHGTNALPKDIINNGFDIKRRTRGMDGTGEYFTNNSLYAERYGEHTIVCLVVEKKTNKSPSLRRYIGNDMWVFGHENESNREKFTAHTYWIENTETEMFCLPLAEYDNTMQLEICKTLCNNGRQTNKTETIDEVVDEVVVVTTRKERRVQKKIVHKRKM
jgi:hypothetical protein